VRTVIHEAAHAVVNEPKRTGQKIVSITRDSGGGKGGYARFEQLPSASQYSNRDQVVAFIGRVLAGGIAEEDEFSEELPSSGRSSDLTIARQIAENAIVHDGLTKKALELPVQNGKVIVTDPVVQAEIKQLLIDGDAYARQRISSEWTTIHAVANELLKKRNLNGDQFDSVVARARDLPKRMTPDEFRKARKCMTEQLEVGLNKR
jgi:ATP-dependent Zn protease